MDTFGQNTAIFQNCKWTRLDIVGHLWTKKWKIDRTEV
jgi:hypothetical protein